MVFDKNGKPVVPSNEAVFLLLSRLSVIFEPKYAAFYTKHESFRFADLPSPDIPQDFPLTFPELLSFFSDGCSLLGALPLNGIYPDFKQLAASYSTLSLEDCCIFLLYYLRLAVRGKSSFWDYWYSGSAKNICLRALELLDDYCLDEEDHAFALRSVSDSLCIELSSTPFFVGRGGAETPLVNGYWIENNPFISRLHAIFTVKQDMVAVADHNSANGTFVNGVRLEAGREQALNIGDRITFANAEFRLVLISKLKKAEKSQNSSSLLSKDILLSSQSIHAAQGHFGYEIVYIHSSHCAVERSWGGNVEPVEARLSLPQHIKTVDQLRSYIRSETSWVLV